MNTLLFASDLPLRGKYHYSYWGFDIYHAKLFMDKDCIYPQCDLVLELKYDADFEGTDIVKRSIEEIDSQKHLEEKVKNNYTEILNNIFPNINKGDIIKGKMIKERSQFYLNNKFIGQIDDPTLTRYFFDIWLSPQTTEPTMRQALLSERL
jgi:hypothetical protein